MKVTAFNVQTQQRQDIESNARTFGELMNDLGYTISSSMRYYDKDSKVTFEHPDAEITQTDFTLVASPRNNKANTSGTSGTEYNLSRLQEIKTKFNNLMDFLMGRDLGDEQPEDCPNCDLIQEIEEIEEGFKD